MSQSAREMGIVAIIALLVVFHAAVVAVCLARLVAISLLMWVPDALILGLCALWWFDQRRWLKAYG